MTDKKYGGPAFPDGGQHDYTGGMTLRDYFIAHAPDSPQPWFRPVMPKEPVSAATLPRDLTQPERRELEGWGDYISTCDMKEPRIRAYAEASDRHHEEVRAYNEELERQRYIQWPAAWADAMLAAREEKI